MKSIFRLCIIGLVFLSFLYLSACAPKKIKKIPSDQIKQTETKKKVNLDEIESEADLPSLVQSSWQDAFLLDDMPIETLKTAINSSRKYFRRLPIDKKFIYGDLEYTTTEILASFDLFEALLSKYNDKEQFIQAFTQNFHIMKSPGGIPSRKVLFTGYFEPVFPGSRIKTSIYNVPAYSLPSDLKTLKLGKFRKSLEGHTIKFRLVDGEIVPYHSREEIMGSEALSDKAEPIIYFKDPVDLFFLQIQGSGIVTTATGEMVRLGYSGANGRAYSSIGKHMVKNRLMTADEASMQKIREYLTNNPSELGNVLYVNESYTFFVEQDIKEGPFGNINVALTPGRSIATDAFRFPKGALGFIQTEIPNCNNEGQCEGKKLISRFVINQDTGGAIKGPGRADIFWGRGNFAAATAGRMKYFGDMYFFVAKKSVLSTLS